MSKKKYTNVFLVSAGSYSDYTVIGIFSTREKAEEYISHCKSNKTTLGSPWDFNEIEEYTIDLCLKEKSRARWIEKVKSGETSNGFIWTSDNRRGYIDSGPEYHNQCAVSYVSAKHAHDLVVKERQRQLRLKLTEKPKKSKKHE